MKKKSSNNKLIPPDKNWFQLLTENSLTGAYILRQNEFLYVNHAILKLFGYTYDEFINELSPADLTHDDDKKLLEKNIRKRVDGETDTIHYSFRGIRKDKKIIICEVLGKRIDIDGSPAIIGTLIDITERKKVEEDLLIAKEKAETADKLKTEFISQISHEIRTPLNNILAYVSLIREEVEDKLSPELAEGFKIIDKSTFRLIKTIDQLLNLSKVQTGNYHVNPEYLDLNEDILEDLFMEFFSKAKQKGTEIVYESLTNKKILGDKYLIQQLFANLIENSVKYTETGKIVIKIYLNPEQNVAVDITDTGIGISEDFLPFIFDSFSQDEDVREKNYEGSGLGLSLVKKYAELNKAEVLVKSIKNKGTTFTIVFNNH